MVTGALLARLAALGLLLVGFALRLWKLGAQELWFDEAASTYVSSKPWQEIVRYVATAGREHPPAYYLLLHGWTTLVGDGEWALRYLSVLFGMLFVAVLGRLGYRFGGRPLALTALGVGAVASFAVTYSQELRMYSLVMLLGALLVWATANILAGSFWAGLWLTLIAIAGVATSYFFAPLIVAADLILLWRRPLLVRRWWPLFLSIHFLLLALGVAFYIAAPGPVQTIRSSILSSGSVWDWPAKLRLPLEAIGGGRFNDSSYTALTVTVTWALTLLGAIAWQRSRRRMPILIFLLAQLGLVAVLPVVDGRYFSGAMVVMYLFLATSLVWCWQWWPRASWLLVPLLVWMTVFPLQQHFRLHKGDFGAAFTAAHGALRGPQDAILFSQPDVWVLVDYYKRRQRIAPQLFYFPDNNQPELFEPEVEARVSDILGRFDRIALGPVGGSNRDPNSLLEKHLLQNAFAISREFWPDNTMVALFSAPRPLQAGPANLDFGSRVRLASSELSRLRVPAGDVIALRLNWEALAPNLPRITVGLQLQDATGLVWATQQTEPCNGWCDSTSWNPGATVTDNRALLVPADVPPGRYTLVLRLDSAEGALGTPQRLGEVEVVPGAPLVPQTEAETVLAGVEIRHLQATPPTVRQGDAITWSAQWQPVVQLPPGWQVIWELKQGDVVQQRWQVAPSSVPYPSAQWPQGQTLRGQGRLTLPGTLEGGEYTLQVHIAAADGAPLSEPLTVSTIEVTERERSFEMPNLGTPRNVAWEQGVHLRAADLPARTTPGSTLPVTLVWEGEGPTDVPYKVFAQLRNGGNLVPAQFDTQPAYGAAPTNTWAEGEIVVDEHPIPLPPDLAPGRYSVVIGLYDETTNVRLPRVGGAGDEYVVGTVEVQAP